MDQLGSALVPAAVFLLFSSLSSCSSGESGSEISEPDVPHAPELSVAIGSPSTSTEGARVTLTASGSGGSGGTSFVWSQTEGPTALLDNAQTASATVLMPLVANTTAFTFRVRATDSANTTATSSVSIDVSPAPGGETVEVQTEHDGARRTYLVYTPTTLASDAWLVFGLHGAGGTMRDFAADGATFRRWFALADANGFVVVFPNGFDDGAGDGLGDSQGWNTFNTNFSSADDFGFLLRVIGEIAAGRAISTDHVFFPDNRTEAICRCAWPSMHLTTCVPLRPLSSTSSAIPYRFLIHCRCHLRSSTWEPTIRSAHSRAPRSGYQPATQWNILPTTPSA
ncbi:MAG: hypothetical protein AAF225_00705 [Pseudomonadota bacterium]